MSARRLHSEGETLQLNVEEATTREQYRIESTTPGSVGAARGIDAALGVGNDFRIELVNALGEVLPVNVVLIYL